MYYFTAKGFLFVNAPFISIRYNIFSHRYFSSYLFTTIVSPFRSAALQPGHSHSVLIASTRKIGFFLAMTKVPAVKVLMKTTSTTSDRSAELRAVGHLSSNAHIPTTTLSSRRGPSLRILILVALSCWTLLQISTDLCRHVILQ